MFIWRLTVRLREQARSHSFLITTNPLWERACSRRGQHCHTKQSANKKPHQAHTWQGFDGR
ncbi:hypothetical protein PG5_61100 [Pseudomonas sp. G5(2012)]|nr:hypothetical protein PG5_61100 [Pseudomonas sp. G5(2012)]